MNKYELHIHTAECDKAARVSAGEIVQLYKDAGYSGGVITDHYASMFFDWFSDELSDADHQKTIERYLKGYYAARNEGEKFGFTVLCGAEVRLENTENDYLIYGLEERDYYNLPLLNKCKNAEELVKILPRKAIVVQAHPFRNEMTVCDISLFFGIEGYNGCTECVRNKMAKLYAENYGKPLTSGSDFHERHHLARGGIKTEHKILTPDDLVNVLKSGEYALIENGE